MNILSVLSLVMQIAVNVDQFFATHILLIVYITAVRYVTSSMYFF